MSKPLHSKQKSADLPSFEHYLRTGGRLTSTERKQRAERKFNPYHDPENGQFTFGPGVSAAASLSSRLTHGGKPYPARIDLRNGAKPYPVRVDVPAKPKRAAPKTPSPPPAIRFEHRPGLDLSAPIITKANTLSDSIHLRTGYHIVVTSGRRNEGRQAEAMYNNYGQPKPPKYVNAAAEDEVRRVYENGRRSGKSRRDIIGDMTNVLKMQTGRGIYLSRHMRSGAIDIRMPPANVLRAIRNHPSVQSVGVEDDHIHIQFR